MDLVSQNLLLTSGGGKKSTFLDDVFSTYLYEGNETSRSINNGVDNTEGGMVWIKNRDNGAFPPYVYDTVRGVNKQLRTSSNANETSSSNTLTAFNNNGFSMGTDTMINRNGDSHVAWNFRKAPGFFDVVTFTSTGNVNQRISHGLECEPGLIICKSLTNTSYWVTYHKELPNEYPSDPWSKSLLLDEAYAAGTLASDTWGTGPTSTDFGFKAGGFAAVGTEWVAYVFAGGSSSAATAKSVDFDGSNDYLSIPDNDAWDISSSDVTVECWAKFDSHNTHDGIVHNLHSSGLPGNGTSGWALEPVSGILNVYWGTTSGSYGNVGGATIPLGQWQHMAFTKSGNTITIYQNGVKTGSGTISGTINPGVVPLQIGGNCVGAFMDGNISNLRITKGQVLYTSSFIPSTEPLTTTSQGATASNVKLLCCNDSSVTGSTVTPGTITNNNGATASTDVPFDDLEAFKFGEDENQNIIKCGSYIGNNNSNGPDVYLGWEPQWVLVKSLASGNWRLLDSMRGIVTGGPDPELEPNSNSSEDTANNRIAVTATGFKVDTASSSHNDNNGYVYIAIRRPDALVGKPAEAGTDVFAMDTGDDRSIIPNYDSGFPVDFAFRNVPLSTGNWQTSARLMQGKYIQVNTNAAEATSSGEQYDSNVGYATDQSPSTVQAWMWKRHAGFDVVTYNVPTSSGQKQINHNLGREPEMIWLKDRGNSDNWIVYNKYLGGGTDPWDYFLYLDASNAQSNSYPNYWGTSASDVNANYFTINQQYRYTGNHIMMLFASVDGISKVGSYTGTGVSGLAVTTGFTPRFLIIKNASWSHGDWFLYDTTRGWTSGTDAVLIINSTGAQSTAGTHATNPTSTGFTVESTDAAVNANGNNFIYYAHA